MNQTTCKSCGAAIVYAVTTSGARMPLDVEPVAGGKYAIVDGDHAVYDRALETGYVSHFATCPNANRHRRGENRDQ